MASDVDTIVYGQPVLRDAAEQRRQRRRWTFLLLLLPIAAIIYPPLYNHRDPSLVGIPFFVWYQFVAVIFGGVVTGVVYLLRATDRSRSE